MRLQDRPSLVGVRAVEPDHDRRVDLHLLERLHDAVGDFLALRDATEDVDEDRPHVGVVVDHLERACHHVGVRAAADVEEVRRRAADLVHDVDGAHREPGTVGDDADVAVEPDVLQTPLVRDPLARVAHLRRVVLLVLGVAEHRVVVERDLGVERVHTTVGREDERVDLDQVGVALGVRTPELEQDVDRAVGRRRVEVGRLDPRAALRLAEPVDGIDVDAGDGVGVLLGDLLDLDAALRRQHPEVQLGAAVERERRVVLLGDVARLLDPDHLDDVALDVHPEDRVGVRADLVGVGSELDAAGLAPAAHLHLGLHHDRVAEGVGRLDGLRRRW